MNWLLTLEKASTSLMMKLSPEEDQLAIEGSHWSIIWYVSGKHSQRSPQEGVSVASCSESCILITLWLLTWQKLIQQSLLIAPTAQCWACSIAAAFIRFHRWHFDYILAWEELEQHRRRYRIRSITFVPLLAKLLIVWAASNKGSESYCR